MKSLVRAILTIMSTLFFSFPALAGNLAHSHILKMPEKERVEVLGGVLNASGKPCDATKTFYQGMDSEGSAYWDVACKNGKSLGIGICF